MVQAEMVEATEFQELSNKYNVSGVPQTTINDGAANITGAVLLTGTFVTSLTRYDFNNSPTFPGVMLIIKPDINIESESNFLISTLITDK